MSLKTTSDICSITIIAFNCIVQLQQIQESRHKENETKQFKQIKHSTNSQFGFYETKAEAKVT